MKIKGTHDGSCSDDTATGPWPWNSMPSIDIRGDDATVTVKCVVTHGRDKEELTMMQL